MTEPANVPEPRPEPRPRRPPFDPGAAGYFSWTQHPAAAGVLAIGLAMTLVMLLVLEAVAPRQSLGAAFDRGLGVFAAFGAAGAALCIAAGAVLRRIPGLKSAEGDDADQP